MKNSMESCNKIGVSFTAFRMQGAGMDGQDFGCLQKMGWLVQVIPLRWPDYRCQKDRMNVNFPFSGVYIIKLKIILKSMWYEGF